MGQPTFVNYPTQNSPANKSKPPARSWLDVDLWFLMTVIALLALGLSMVYSSSWLVAMQRGQGTGGVFFSQLIFAAIGLLVAFVLSRLDYHIVQIRFIALGLLIGTIGMLLIVALMSFVSGSLTRGLLGKSVQPSELAKIMIIVYLSVWLTSKGDVIHSVSFGLIPVGIILGVTAALIYAQPDISATVTVVVLGFIMFVLAGGSIRQIFAVFVVALSSAAFAYFVLHRMPGLERIDQFVAGLQDIDKASYHIQRALEAIVRGGFFGLGPGNSVTKMTGLPVPWTDSIFVVLIEELGLLGGIFTIGLFASLMWRGLKIANDAPDQLGKLLASGLTLWIALEAIINISVLVNAIPFAGNALPFVSSGGSSMLMTMIAVGLIMSVSRMSKIKAKDENEGRSYNAVVDLRRRDGGRSVSRSNRFASPRV
jgi:cell division protein FtsW